MTYLHQHFHIYIQLSENIKYEKIVQYVERLYYSNYTIYLVTINPISIIHPYIRVLPLQQNIENTLLRHCVNLPPNDLVIFIENVEEVIEKTWLLTLNNYILTKKPTFLLCTSKTFDSYVSKVGVFQHIIENKLNENGTLKQLCSMLCKENIHQWDMETNLFSQVTDIDITSIKAYNQISIPIKKDIHILLATYDRNKNIHIVFNMLKTQTVKNIHLHLLDNNENKHVQTELDSFIEPFYKDMTISLHRYNKNTHCFGRITLIREIIRQYMMDFIIMFDDDQIYDETWLQDMISCAKPLGTLSWYGKLFNECDYWKSTLTYIEIDRKRKREITEFAYFGPGGAIFDIQLFMFKELYQYEKYSQDIRAIDDIWMSFVFKKYLNIPFYRNITHLKKTIDWTNFKKTTWSNLKNSKNELFKMLANDYQWDVTKTSHECYNINTFFDRIYVFCNDFSKLIKFRTHHLCFQWVPYDDYEKDVKTLLQKCSKQRICIFHEDFCFSEFYFYQSQKMVKELKQGTHTRCEFNNLMKIENAVSYNSSKGVCMLN